MVFYFIAAIFNWFIPVLRLDSDIKFVHYIKLAEAMTGLGTETMRPPRLSLAGEEREQVYKVNRYAHIRRVVA